MRFSSYIPNSDELVCPHAHCKGTIRSHFYRVNASMVTFETRDVLASLTVPNFDISVT
jgi:hypothetical protein